MSKKDRYTGIIHAVASVILTAAMATEIVGGFTHGGRFKLDGLLILGYFALNLLVSWQLISCHATNIHRIIALPFAVTAVAAAVLTFMEIANQPDYFLIALFGITAAAQFKLAWDYWVNGHPGRTSKLILGLLCIALLFLALIFVAASVEDGTVYYTMIAIPAASAICHMCLLIRSTGMMKEESIT